MGRYRHRGYYSTAARLQQHAALPDNTCNQSSSVTTSRYRLAQEAASELAAAAYVPATSPNPQYHELCFCFPAPGAAMYRDARTGINIILRRDKGAKTFSCIGVKGWQPWQEPND